MALPSRQRFTDLGQGTAEGWAGLTKATHTGTKHTHATTTTAKQQQQHTHKQTNNKEPTNQTNDRHNLHCQTIHAQKFNTEAASFIFNQPETKSDAFIFGVDYFHLSSIKDESNAVELDMQALQPPFAPSGYLGICKFSFRYLEDDEHACELPAISVTSA